MGWERHRINRETTDRDAQTEHKDLSSERNFVTTYAWLLKLLHTSCANHNSIQLYTSWTTNVHIRMRDYTCDWYETFLPRQQSIAKAPGLRTAVIGVAKCPCL
jgi:hypothetical protein